MRSPAAGLVGLAIVLTGCISAAPGPDPILPPGALDHDALEALIGEPIALAHDHTKGSLHTGGVNLAFRSWSTLDVALGENGFANFVFHDDADESLLLVATDGDMEGGFVIADARDPMNLKRLGAYRVSGNGFQEVRVTPDGRFAIMNVQELPRPTRPVVNAGALVDCGTCLHLVNIEDRANPRLESLFPVDLIGSHNMEVFEMGGQVHVAYVGQPLGAAPPGNYVGIARLVETPAGAALVKVGEYRHEEAPLEPQPSFPHDVIVAQHPFTRQWILYVSHWQGGAITVDITNPAMPRELAVVADPAPSDVANIHWFAPEPRPRGERLIAWSAPEIGGLDTGSGVMRAYDVTDPASFSQIGTWELPGEVIIPGGFIFSPHIVQVDMARGLAAISHYHAGVWILDVTDPTMPRALGYYLPHGDPSAPYDGPFWWKKPNFDPDGYLPNVYQARWRDGQLWVSERGSGIYVLDYTGPVPGPLV